MCYCYHGWVRKSFVSPVPSCFMHEALRTGLVSNYYMWGGGGGGGGALRASPSVSEMVKKCWIFK